MFPIIKLIKKLDANKIEIYKIYESGQSNKNEKIDKVDKVDKIDKIDETDEIILLTAQSSLFIITSLFRNIITRIVRLCENLYKIQLKKNITAPEWSLILEQYLCLQFSKLDPQWIQTLNQKNALHLT